MLIIIAKSVMCISTRGPLVRHTLLDQNRVSQRKISFHPCLASITSILSFLFSSLFWRTPRNRPSSARGVPVTNRRTCCDAAFILFSKTTGAQRLHWSVNGHRYKENKHKCHPRWSKRRNYARARNRDSPLVQYTTKKFSRSSSHLSGVQIFLLTDTKMLGFFSLLSVNTFWSLLIYT